MKLIPKSSVTAEAIHWHSNTQYMEFMADLITFFRNEGKTIHTIGLDDDGRGSLKFTLANLPAVFIVNPDNVVVIEGRRVRVLRHSDMLRNYTVVED